MGTDPRCQDEPTLSEAACLQLLCNFAAYFLFKRYCTTLLIRSLERMPGADPLSGCLGCSFSGLMLIQIFLICDRCSVSLICDRCCKFSTCLHCWATMHVDICFECCTFSHSCMHCRLSCKWKQRCSLFCSSDAHFSARFQVTGSVYRVVGFLLGTFQTVSCFSLNVR